MSLFKSAFLITGNILAIAFLSVPARADSSLWVCRAKSVNLGSSSLRLTPNYHFPLSCLGAGDASQVILDKKQPRYINLTYENISARLPMSLSIQLRRSGELLGATVIVSGERTEIAPTADRSFDFKADAPRGDNYSVSGSIECVPFAPEYMFTSSSMSGHGEPGSFTVADYEAIKCDAWVSVPDLAVQLQGSCLHGDASKAVADLKVSPLFPAKGTVALENGKVTYLVDDFVCTATTQDPSTDQPNRYCSDGYTVPNAKKIVVPTCD